MRGLASSGMAAVLALSPAPASAVELIVNGGFETNSGSAIVTPAGWTNVGHQETVLPYATFGTPVYEGIYYYDLGGYGLPSGPAGDGIQQTVATVIGQSYTLRFGLSAENTSGTSVLSVRFNGIPLLSYTQTADGAGAFKKAFTTQTYTFLALTPSTTISFIEGTGSDGGNGNNDPLIDGVSFQLASADAVPEPTTWGMMLLGFGAMGFALRRRTSNVSARIRFA